MSQSPAAKSAWTERNKHRIPEINKHWKLRNVYGITPERFEEMYEEQGHKCAICKEDFKDGTDAYVDHDHVTKWVRGLLCNNCNFAIGLLKDSVAVVNSAADYLITNVAPADFVFQKIPYKRKTNARAERTPEWRRKQSEARKGKEPWNKGKAWSDDMKQKLSESAKKRHELAREKKG